jgi:hypothetical protein
MSTYYGDKALDAEIYLDLISGDLTMDYSLNKHSNGIDSNRLVLKDEYKHAPQFEKFKKSLSNIPWLIFSIMYSTTMLIIITHLGSRGKLKNKNYQIEHQKIMKEMSERLYGTFQFTLEAPFHEKVVTAHVRKNLWIKYTLEGECQDKIKSISLKRNFSTRTFLGYKTVGQRGWSLTFEFTDVPQTGRCIIEHV